jgi:hypothetical protein
LTNQSPLNNGFDLPSAFKNNNIRDQSLAGGLTTVISPSCVNELRMQYAHRNFDFPTVSTHPTWKSPILLQSASIAETRTFTTSRASSWSTT